jgi:hypothetical protein
MGQSGAAAICAWMKSAKGSPRIPQIMNKTPEHGAVCPPATGGTGGRVKSEMVQTPVQPAERSLSVEIRALAKRSAQRMRWRRWWGYIWRLGSSAWFRAASMKSLTWLAIWTPCRDHARARVEDRRSRVLR